MQPYLMSFSHENELVGGTYFHMYDLVRRIVSTQRQKAIRNIAYMLYMHLQSNLLA